MPTLRPETETFDLSSGRDRDRRRKKCASRVETVSIPRRRDREWLYIPDDKHAEWCK